jgi:hypothetical protein
MRCLMFTRRGVTVRCGANEARDTVRLAIHVKLAVPLAVYSKGPLEAFFAIVRHHDIIKELSGLSRRDPA